MTTAVALDAWHTTHTHCARCGARTRIAEAGMVRACPADGSLHHPRVDPAVIMTVADDDDRVLLGHQARWPARRFSTLAGFVEPGESLEQAVAREVHEETGVVVDTATYLGSQPWPFPNSLMLGFHAHATTTRITVDEVEISEARWFTRDALAAAVASGEVRLPPPVSIARRLIERWHGAPLGTS
jgi:NAD+ diphosphatase